MFQNPAAGMVLGCFIAVMVLLAIIIIIICVADNRIDKMLTNQSNQVATFSSIEKALLGKYAAGLASPTATPTASGAAKSGFMNGTNGSQMGSISPSQYPNMALARQNQQFGSSISVGGGSHYNPILDGCGSGNCGGSSSGGMGLYNVQSAATGTNAPTNSTEAAAELAYFESMLGPDFAAAAGTGTGTGTGTMPSSRPSPNRPPPNRPPSNRPPPN